MGSILSCTVTKNSRRSMVTKRFATKGSVIRNGRPRLRRPIRELLGLLLPRPLTEPTRMVQLTVVMTHGALLRRPTGSIYPAPRQASRFLTRAEPLGSMFKVPIQALVPLTEDQTGCCNPPGCGRPSFAGPGRHRKAGSWYSTMSSAGRTLHRVPN